ncbi:probable O-methyltransferase 3 [Euphorbia lathyris]|uniref:probable O-methyltransferase 3 n=1 Tax=Euphorbia lathyris TaxID=212925 RepID=UPI0033131C4D
MELINEKTKFQNHDELLKSHAHIWNQTFNFIKSMSLKCAVELSIPDIIHNHAKPMTLSELQAALPSKPQHLHRLMRILVDSGFFSLSKTGENRYILTPESLLLLKDHPLSARPYILAVLDPILTEPWQFLSAWFRDEGADSTTAFSMANGNKTMWEMAGSEERFNRVFNGAMESDSWLIGEVLIGKCREVFDGVVDVVDVGGGTGTLGKIVVGAFPRLNCTVLDLPHVVAGLEDSENLRFLAGDMFEFIPPADVIMFKMIFHLLNDEKSLKLLKKCKEAIILNGDGKLMIMDIVMDQENKVHHSASETTNLYDLEMMVLVSGIERNEKQWAKLFFDAGFTSYKINHVLGLRSLILVFP